MKGPVLLTRAQADAERSTCRLAQLGIGCVIAPVIRIEMLDAARPAGRPDGVVVTSRHAVPALRSQAQDLRSLPVFAVGPRTALALAAAGFQQVTTAHGTGASLAELVAHRLSPGARLLHAAGRDRKAEPEASLSTLGYEVAPWIVYAAKAVPHLPDAAASALSDGRLRAALHYSGRSLHLLLKRSSEAGLSAPLLALPHACLSHEIAEALQDAGADRVAVARRPEEDCLFQALCELTGWSGDPGTGSPAPHSRC